MEDSNGTGPNHPQPTLKTFKEIYGIVCKILRPGKYLDRESIAQELWIKHIQSEASQHNYTCIRNACYDALRRAAASTRADRVYSSENEVQNGSTADTSREFIEILISSTQLSPLEHQLLYYKFYTSFDEPAIASLLGISEHRLREQTWLMLEKLKSSARVLKSKESD